MSEESDFGERMFHLAIVIPRGILYEGITEKVEINTMEGEIGILKGHIPLTAIVKPGKIKIKEADGTKEIVLRHGIVEIFSDKVIVVGEE